MLGRAAAAVRAGPVMPLGNVPATVRTGLARCDAMTTVNDNLRQQLTIARATDEGVARAVIDRILELTIPGDQLPTTNGRAALVASTADGTGKALVLPRHDIMGEA